MLLASPFAEGSEATPAFNHKAAEQASATQEGAPNRQFPHLRMDDRLGDLLDHRAFQGFSYLMLPWDNRDYDKAMPLRDIGQLLPYHTQVDPQVVISSLNRMVDDVNGGRAIFTSFYTDAQKKLQPALKNTGLFFFRGKPGAPFAVIAPGGGFAYVGSVHEGFPYAAAISERGLNAFVLKYRVGEGERAATQDLAAAISYIAQHAHKLDVSLKSYSLWGSSAGARMVAAIGSHGVAHFGGMALPKPSVVVMAYTAHSEVTASEPPTFVVVGESDAIAPPATMEARVASLRNKGTKVEYHSYPGLGHGFGIGQGTSAQGWIAQASQFWERDIEKVP